MNGSTSTSTHQAGAPSTRTALSAATLALHADEFLNNAPTTDVSPALHVSTTFRYAEDPDALVPASERHRDSPSHSTNTNAADGNGNGNDNVTPLETPDVEPASFDHAPHSDATASAHTRAHAHGHGATLEVDNAGGIARVTKGMDLDGHVYSRYTAPNATRFEALLTALLGGPALTYASGLSAFHALLVHVNPRVIAISGGYHGCHGVIGIHQKLTGLKKIELHASDEEWDAQGLGKGDIVHVETPLNPTGEAQNLEYYAERAHRRGAILTVDATFAPPQLQDVFAHGADIVMHSGTKYFGGHSDMLCGILATRSDEHYRGLFQDRLFLGNVMGSLEGWLGVRSARTLQLRVERQSKNAEQLVAWLHENLSSNGDAATNSSETNPVKSAVSRVFHASLQKDDMPWLRKQMPNGFGPVFAIHCHTKELARRLPSKLRLFQHATSLGGVESLIEWRRMSDEGCDPRLLRLSIGIEAFEDLKADLLQAFQALAAETK